MPNRATGYARLLDDPLGVEPRRANIMTIAYRGNGAGGGYATAEDLFRFVRALRANRLLEPESTELFTTPKVDFPGTPHPEKYAFGFSVGECGGKRTIGHAGGGPNSGVSSNLYAFADGSWTIVVLTNYDPPVGDDFAWGLCEFLARQ
jgi:CubicO group peptidase (beta-lactamase class C family)